MINRSHVWASCNAKEAIIREPLIVTPEATVMETVMKMSQAHSYCDTDKTVNQQGSKFLLNARSSCVLVVKAEQVVGIITERDIVQLSVKYQSLKGLINHQVMVKSVVTLQESQFRDIFSAINLLQQYKIRHLPILDEQEHLVGLVTHETLQHITQPIDLLRLRLVREVMVREVVCAELTASMLDVAQQMTLHNISSVVITESRSIKCPSPVSIISEASENKSLHLNKEEIYAKTQKIPVGIVTERDLVQFQAVDLNLAQYNVGALMSSPVFTVKPDECLWTVQKMMQRHFIHRVVVIDEQNKLVGIVTQTSVLQALNPLELYKLAEVLEAKVERLEAEKVVLLQSRTQELEKQVEARTHILKTKIEKEKLLAELGTQMLASFNLLDLLSITVERLRQFLRCDRVNIWKFESEWQSVVVAESTDSVLSLVGEKIDDTCFKQDMIEVYRQGRIRVVSDIYTTEMSDCHREMLIRLKTRAKILIPLLCGEQLWGLINITESQYARNWTTEEIELIKAVSIQIGIALKQITIRQQLEQELEQRKQTEIQLSESQQLSQTDGLTQIANRRRFDEVLQQEWKRSQREQLPLSLILFDVDYFKNYNDCYGHIIGDECLVKLAQATQRIVYRLPDLVARYGGEEFVILLPNTDETGAIIIARRLEKEIRNLAIPHQNSKISKVITISIGISSIVPTKQIQTQQDSQSSKILVTKADQALYQAKKQGRNCYVVYTENLND